MDLEKSLEPLGKTSLQSLSVLMMEPLLSILRALFERGVVFFKLTRL